MVIVVDGVNVSVVGPGKIEIVGISVAAVEEVLGHRFSHTDGAG